MNTVIALVNKKTYASNVVSGMHVSIAEPSVVEMSVDNVSDIVGFQRQGDYWDRL
ncbi:hypothetical protein [Pseudomonas chlororaphis]|uniref:hypothetical protein n=1 Tax=Pseudomonas chlororaphis TaxID=587753 RepID=UPI0039E375EF